MGTSYYLTRIATPEEESTLYKFGFEVPKVILGKDISGKAFLFYVIKGSEPLLYVHKPLRPEYNLDTFEKLWSLVKTLVEERTHCIQDEYENVITLNKFKELIESKQGLEVPSEVYVDDQNYYFYMSFNPYFKNTSNY